MNNGQESFEDLKFDYFIKIGVTKDFKHFAVETNVPDIVTGIGMLEGVGEPGIKNHVLQLQRRSVKLSPGSLINLLRGKNA